MKRIFALLIIVLILTGCTNGEEMDRALELRKKVQHENGCSFTATITADYGDAIYTFQMECQFYKDGSLFFDVVYPENISGITGEISAQGGRLNFDNKMLAFALLADGQLSPVSTPWIIMNGIRCGYLRSCGPDGDDIHIQIDNTYNENALTLDVWCNRYIPKCAEILYCGRRILSMKFENFRFL